MRIYLRNKGAMLLALLATVYSTGLLAEDVEPEGFMEVRTEVPDGSSQIPKGAGNALIAMSGEWTSAGLSIPRMILHDLTFYVASDTSPPCAFSMSFVLSQTSSRTFRRFNLDVTESVEIHFEAGIDTSNLRFGTIVSPGGGTCVRNWVATGFAAD